MNIFALDDEPRSAAKSLCDQHVTKMLVEYAQILWTALRRHGYQGTGYKTAYPKHPSTRWAGNNRANFLWLIQHAVATSQEYSYRYSKPAMAHGSVRWIYEARKHSELLPEGDLECFSIAIAPTTKAFRFIDPLRPVHTYRIYYALDKTWATWTKREEPEWLDYYRRTYGKVQPH